MQTKKTTIKFVSYCRNPNARLSFCSTLICSCFCLFLTSFSMDVCVPLSLTLFVLQHDAAADVERIIPVLTESFSLLREALFLRVLFLRVNSYRNANLSEREKVFAILRKLGKAPRSATFARC